ncbi:hypothetical protein HRbin15_00030 [bacterium HR15]|nr:hypothetical protein HRbin15_00030 [bacterium HR15]
MPAIGENEFVWSGGSPATLVIPARALGYTWGWEPDLSWIAEETVFRVEPEIPSDDTKPGERTVARGRELVAQSLEGQTGGYVDDLLYRSKHLPPHNSDFGKKRVVFEVEDKVDYAEIEVFYPAEASNHPPGGRGCSGRFLIDINTFRLIACECNAHVEPENWFYYYSQVYGASDVWYAKGETTPYMLGLTCMGTRPGTGERVAQIYILPSTSPCRVALPGLEEAHSTHLLIPIFRCQNRTIEFTRRFLCVAGIHKFIAVVEHERVHKKMYDEGNLYPSDDSCPDRDNDGLCDRWEDENGIDSTTPQTVPPFPDSELVAYIISYGKVLDAKEKWKEDWATCGLQFGIPPSPFPWAYTDINAGNRSISPPQGNILKALPACR